MDLYFQRLFIKIFYNKHIKYYLMHLLHQSIRLWVFIVVGTGLISKSFRKGVRSNLKPDILSKKCVNAVICLAMYS